MPRVLCVCALLPDGKSLMTLRSIYARIEISAAINSECRYGECERVKFIIETRQQLLQFLYIVDSLQTYVGANIYIISPDVVRRKVMIAY